MAIRSETVLFLACWDLFGYSKTMAELQKKKRLLCYAVAILLVIVFVISLMGAIELYRASFFLSDIEDIHEEINRIHGNVSEIMKKKEELIQQILQKRLEIMEEMCIRRGYDFRKDDKICLQPVMTKYTQFASVDNCQSIGADGLFKLDSNLKRQMLQLKPFVEDDKQGDPFWIDGNVDNDGEWKFSNGTTIPNDLRHENSLKNPTCFVSLLSNHFKISTESCDSEQYSVCEIDINRVYHEFDKDSLNLDEL